MYVVQINVIYVHLLLSVWYVLMVMSLKVIDVLIMLYLVILRMVLLVNLLQWNDVLNGELQPVIQCAQQLHFCSKYSVTIANVQNHSFPTYRHVHDGECVNLAQQVVLIVIII